MRIEPIKVSEWIGRVHQLVRENWEELEQERNPEPPTVDLAVYEGLERADAIIALGVFDDVDRNQTTLVGYSVAFLARHPHYPFLVASNDVLFLARAHRTGRVGVRLIEATEAAARERGAKMMIWHAKEGTAMHSILPRMGCVFQELIYTKELG